MAFWKVQNRGEGDEQLPNGENRGGRIERATVVCHGRLTAGGGRRVDSGKKWNRMRVESLADSWASADLTAALMIQGQLGAIMYRAGLVALGSTPIIRSTM